MLAAALAMVVCVIPVGALTMEKEAAAIKSGAVYKNTLKYDTPYYFKIDVTKSGKIEWKISFESYHFDIGIYDEDGKQLEYEWTSGDMGVDYTGILEGNLSVEPGRYYIMLKRTALDYGSGDVKFTVKYPSSSSNTVTAATSSSNASIAIYIDEGDKIQLSAFVSGKEASSVKWSSSNSKVVKVNSKGRITGVSEGTAIVKAKSGSTTVSIVVIVEE